MRPWRTDRPRRRRCPLRSAILAILWSLTVLPAPARGRLAGDCLVARAGAIPGAVGVMAAPAAGGDRGAAPVRSGQGTAPGAVPVSTTGPASQGAVVPPAGTADPATGPGSAGGAHHPTSARHVDSPGTAPASQSPRLGSFLAPSHAGSRFRFEEAAPEAGFRHVTLAGRPDKDHLLDSAGTGAAWVDYDRDGDLDAYLVNGWRLEGSQVAERGRHALYRNDGDGRFVDVTQAAGVEGDGEWGSGVAVADQDGDGWPDLFVTSFGRNLLYRNRGDGSFREVAREVGIAAPGWNTGAAFLDADGDGDLDLYLARYIRCTLEEVLDARPTLDWKGLAKVAMGPFGLPGGVDAYFRAEGPDAFQEATAEAGLEDRGEGFGFAVLAADLNGDRLPDLYVANDSDPNYFYRNEGNGRFREAGLWSGNALDANGAAQAGMGAAVGDVDADGDPDLVVTNFSQDFTTLYRNEGNGFFEDASGASGVGPATYNSLSWGAVLADLDADADLDLVIANGHIYPQVDRHPEIGQSYRQRNLLLENDGRGRFAEPAEGAGPGFQEAASSRGLAAGDYDDDGDLDLLLTNLDAPPSLLRNESPQGGWLLIELEVAPGEPSPLGARVTLGSGPGGQVREAASGGSFLSAHDPRQHFGLGTAATVPPLRVDWPRGGAVRFRGLAPGFRFTIRRAPPPAVPPQPSGGSGADGRDSGRGAFRL